LSFAEIGKACGISETHAKWICYQAIKKLRRECKRLGISPADILGMPRSMMARMEDYA